MRLDPAQYQEQIRETLKFLRQAKAAFEKSGYEVQTIRITTQPFPEYTRGLADEQVLAFFRDYDALAVKEGFDAAIGPAMMGDGDDPHEAELLGKIIANSKTLEASVFIAGKMEFTGSPFMPPPASLNIWKRTRCIARGISVLRRLRWFPPARLFIRRHISLATGSNSPSACNLQM